MYCYVCRKAGPDIAGKTFKRESLVYQNKTYSQVWNMKNVSMWYQKKPIPQLSIFCIIQSISWITDVIWKYHVGKKPFFYFFINEMILLRALQFIPAPTSPWLVRTNFFTCQQKNVTCHNSYYISPICIYLYIIINALYEAEDT
jgi:hypothetical protein